MVYLFKGVIENSGRSEDWGYFVSAE